MTDLSNPLLWAVIIGWILTVALHEFAHGLVASLGGDYTIRERGGLTLNPLQYVDPVNSILLPIVFLVLGGVPLPGGATYVRHDLLRSKLWDSAVSLAGPAMNFLLFVLLSLPFHPVIGWMHPGLDPNEWTGAQIFLATLAQLQLISVVLNLIPIPPLDGFGIISPYFDEETRAKFNTHQVATIGLLVLFFLIWNIPQLWTGIYHLKNYLMFAMGFDPVTMEFFRVSYNHVLFGG